ncbi:MAG: Gfo/Idh/MocA family oxidoreductase [Clostridia bacterium]|nr:Gfo/Idh/MocA family oxidoreductase [Clostridia bacterium]
MINGERTYERPIRWAMVGGGRGSNIGYIHRSAALRDRRFELVAGAFDIDPERGQDFGIQLGLDPDRCYRDYQTLFAEEAKRADGIEAVSIATPNSTHYTIAKAALQAGLHVVVEKPMCFENEQAAELVELSQKMNRVVGVTYGYAGHQAIEQARQMVKNGELGDIRIIQMQFAHGGNSAAVETASAAQKWRVDPKVAGPTFVIGDLATHPLFLTEIIVPELKLKRLLCSRQSFIKSRAPLEDNATILMEYDNGAVGTLWASSVNAGSVFGHKIRVTGSKASVEWDAVKPNQLLYEVQGEPARTLERGAGYLYPGALAEDRIGGGHPEGLFEAWSNLYMRFGMAMDRATKGGKVGEEDFWYPDVRAGYEGVKYVNKCVESADKGAVWVEF